MKKATVILRPLRTVALACRTSLGRLSLFVLLEVTPFGFVSAADVTSEQREFFEKKVRPILAERCYKCHSSQSEKVKGGLLLDSREAAMKGGEDGSVIAPGAP